MAWLKATQWDSAEGHTPKSNWYGGAGYGKHQRPDLSNTQTMLMPYVMPECRPRMKPFKSSGLYHPAKLFGKQSRIMVRG